MYNLAHIQFSREATIYFAGSVLFVFLGLAIVILILCSRVIKTQRAARFKRLCEEFQKSINEIIILGHDEENSGHSLLASYLNELRKNITTSFGKQVLIDLIIANKQNLKGNSADFLRKIYIRLHLKKFSCAKLSRSSVLKKIQGLHELAEMECVDALPAIQPLLNHKSLIVRQESFIAVVRLGAAPFALVDKFSDPITPWMQLIMHKHLTVSSPERIPKFHHWFYQPNREIQKFAIAMAHQFRQTEAIPHLAVLLISQDIEMAGLAVNALGDMGAVEYADAIANLGKSNPLNDALSVQVIRALGQIGNAEKHGAWLAWQMTHGSYHIRLEAMGVMRKLNLNCRDFLIDFNTANDDVFESMYAHITEPLLQ